MGVKKFFAWIKKTQPQTIINFTDAFPKSVDNLLIDMNGIFHTSAQYVYRYGKNSTDKFVVFDNFSNRRKYFNHVCETIDKYVKLVKPTKKLILCVDGVAPASKQNQMRSRRIRPNPHTEEKNGFDSNNISVGTEFMHYLTMSIDIYIKKKVSTDWNFEVIFSNEKVPGEGEHKIINYIRENKNESFCIHGLDADLILLSLFTHTKNIYILRENQYKHETSHTYHLILIDEVAESIIKNMSIENYEDPVKLINDFVFLSFLVGNDFLPHIPCIEIIMNGMEIMFEIYKMVITKYGYFVSIEEKIEMNHDSLEEFFKLISEKESSVLSEKAENSKFFEDEILKSTATYNPGTDIYDINIEKYREIYNRRFSEELNKVILSYISGLYWVLKYYNQNVLKSENSFDWTWYYPYHYSPFSYDIWKFLKTNDISLNFKKNTSPISPLFQLLSILPERNKSMFPVCMQSIIPKTEEFKVDLSGMSQEWEGIALISFIDREELKKKYNQTVNFLTEKEKKLNEVGFTFIYSKTTNTYYSNYFNENFQHNTFRTIY